MAIGFPTRLADSLSGLNLNLAVPDLPAINFRDLTGLNSFDETSLELRGLDLDQFRNLDVTSLADIAALAGRLPSPFSGPDGTGEVPTGAATIGREEAATAATLAAVPRIVDALGPDAVSVDLRGRSFDVVERYEDLVSGFSALHLRPRDGGAEIFAIDGLEVGSHADAVAAGTLGRLQVQSAEFQEMVADAATHALATRGHVLFTAPSLGGAMAEVAAYETAEHLAASGQPFPTGTVRLVTVDGLGGRDAAEAINGGALQPIPLQLIDALNLRNDGDIVTRIGSHIGATTTLPTFDASGQRVQLSPGDAHVDVVSLLQVLNSDALFALGQRGAPAEISGFAAASNALSAEAIKLYLDSGAKDSDAPHDLQIPGVAAFDPTRTVYTLDADSNGVADIAVHLAQPANPAIDPFVL